MAFNNRNLFDDFRFDGRWWIPGNPDGVVFGTLHYKPSIGIRLELMGTIGPADIAERVARWAKSTKWDFILGLSDEGKKCTLQTVREMHKLVNLEGAGAFGRIDRDADFLASLALRSNSHSWFSRNCKPF